ncbi:hypothetical protein ACP70R_027301 [Stipagrostis hirtigluma subsp. patula]
MMPRKVAVLLLLLPVFAITCPGQVIGECTKEQKEAVLRDCEKFIKPGRPNRQPIPIMGQACCNAVNKVPKKGDNIDMQCIVDLLTDAEKDHHDEDKILNLPNHCQVIGECTKEQKEAILHDCQKFIKHGHPKREPIPIMGQACCNAVNKVPKKDGKIDMQCIVDLLTNAEKNHHNEDKIMNLPNHCQEHTLLASTLSAGSCKVLEIKYIHI